MTPLYPLFFGVKSFIITYSKDDKVEAINTAAIAKKEQDLTPSEEGSREPKAPPAQMSVEDRWKRLKELFDQKIITEKEYETNRKLILESLTSVNDKKGN